MNIRLAVLRKVSELESIYIGFQEKGGEKQKRNCVAEKQLVSSSTCNGDRAVPLENGN